MSVKSDVASAVSDERGGGWVTIDCVVCGRDDKMRVCMDDTDPRFTYFQCWSPSCGVRGFFGKHEEYDVKPKRNRDEIVFANLPAEFEPLSTKYNGHKQRRLEKFRQYLYGRDVSQFLIDEANLGCVADGKLSGMIIIPYYKSGEVIGWCGRYIHYKRYHYPEDWPKTQWPYNGDILLQETDKPAIVVEGQFDALNLWPYGTGVGGQPTEDDWDLLLEARRPLVLAFDADEGVKSEYGRKKLLLKAFRKGFKLTVAWMRLPPGTDPGGHNRDKFLKRAFALARKEDR